jgi:hypothetical protein
MSDKLETWAVVDVPKVDEEPGYSRFFNPSAVYSWTPVSEEVARAAVASFAVRPLGTWTPSVLRSLPAPTIDQDLEDSDDWEGEDDRLSDY